MKTSDNTQELCLALVNFQKEVGKIKKDTKNPFFKSKYAALSTILDVVSEPLINNGLSITQFPVGEYGLTTRLMHTSGQWMEEEYFMKPVKHSPQDAGSVITYQRRYAIGAILFLNIDDDDDANEASGLKDKSYQTKTVGKTNSKPQVENKPYRTLEQRVEDCKSPEELIKLYNDNQQAIKNDATLLKKMTEKKEKLNADKK